MGKFYWNTYHGPEEKPGQLSAHKERDGAAFVHLMDLLITRKGLEYGKMLLNYPTTYRITEHVLEGLRSKGVPDNVREEIRKLKDKPPLHKAGFADVVRQVIGPAYAERYMGFILEAALVEVKVDTSFLGPDDYLVQTTRPFLHDHIQEGHKMGERSNTSLEKKVFQFLGQFFNKLSRHEVILSASMAKELERAAIRRGDDSDNKTQIKFIVQSQNENACGSYNEFSRDGHKWYQPNADEKRASVYKTAVYLIHATNVLDNGAGLIISFGMNGRATLGLAYLLRTGRDSSGRELSSLLDHPAFVMAEMTMGASPPNPSNLSFMDDWKVEVLLEHPIEAAERKEKSVDISDSPS